MSFSSVFLFVGFGQFLEEFRGPNLIVEPPSRVDFSNNTGTVLRCSAEGFPVPEIRWLYADGSSVENVVGLRQIYTNGTLVINSFQAERFRQDVHAIVYKCLAFNNVGVVSSRNVQVRAGRCLVIILLCFQNSQQTISDNSLTLLILNDPQ